MRKNAVHYIPWPTFVKDTKTALNNCIVSFKKTKNNNGQLHKESLYGEIQLPRNASPAVKASTTKVKVIKKGIKDLNGKQVLNIVDNTVRDLVIGRINEYLEQKGKGANAFHEKTKPADINGAFAEPLYHKNGHPIKKARIAFNEPNAQAIRTDENGKPVFALPENNHHYAFYADTETGKIQGDIVNYWTLAERKKDKKPLIDREGKAGQEFLFSLQMNEMVLAKTNEKGQELPYDDEQLKALFADRSRYKELFPFVYKTQNISKGDITFRHHSMAKIKISHTVKKDDDSIGKLRISTIRKISNFIKIKISPAGFISFTKD